jgi:hypothetical protein
MNFPSPIQTNLITNAQVTDQLTANPTETPAEIQRDRKCLR